MVYSWAHEWKAHVSAAVHANLFIIIIIVGTVNRHAYDDKQKYSDACRPCHLIQNKIIIFVEGQNPDI